MLLRSFYKMSLDCSGRGLLRSLSLVGEDINDVSLKALQHYIHGYQRSARDSGDSDRLDDWNVFMEWLQREHYPSAAGWAYDVIKETGDGVPAFDRFIALLYEYLEQTKPAWFLEFNSEVQPSEWFSFVIPDNENFDYSDLESAPSEVDIRIRKHIDLVDDD